MSAAPLDPALEAALVAVARTLREAVRERGIAPSLDATLRSIGEAAGLEIDVAWDDTDVTGEVAYDALVTAPAVGTFALSLAPEGTTPWPLRGALSANERDVLRVNGEKLDVERVVAFLDFMWREPGVLRSLVDAATIAEVSRSRDVRATEAHLAQAEASFRARHDLADDDAVAAWRSENGVTADGLRVSIAGAAARLALIDAALGPADLDEAWRRHGPAHDAVRVLRLRRRDEADAEALAARIGAGGPATFHEAFEADLGAGVLPPVAVGLLYRRNVSGGYFDTLFGTPPGAIIGPIAIGTSAGKAFDVVRVIAREPARRDDAALRERAFEDWLRERRRRATIEWFWGPAAATAALG